MIWYKQMAIEILTGISTGLRKIRIENGLGIVAKRTDKET